jgi:hypothetical protein
MKCYDIEDVQWVFICTIKGEFAKHPKDEERRQEAERQRQGGAADFDGFDGVVEQEFEVVNLGGSRATFLSPVPRPSLL